MPSGVTSWSQTAATNASADSTINFLEGQAPSSLNDSSRALMASVAKYRDDNAGTLVAGGTSTAYTITSNQGFASKSAMNGAELSFTMSATNGASPTLNVDGLGGDPITLDGTNAVPTGTLIANSVYTAVYYSSGTAWRLKDFYQLPFTVPIGAMIDFTGTTAPNSNFVFPYGQAISRSTYSAYFTLVSTAYGTGDGSTTFNIPDLRGRVIAGKDDMGGSSSFRLTSGNFGANPDTLGAAGGSETKTLITANLPPYTPAGSISGSANSTDTNVQRNVSNITIGTGGSNTVGLANPGVVTVNGNQYSFTGSAQGGTSTAFAIVQPTLVLNKLLRII